MGKDTAYPQSTALSKTESQTLAISDFRKERSTFKLFSRGVRTREDIVEATALMARDLAQGKMESAEIAVHCGLLDRNLAAKAQDLQEMELHYKLETIGRKAKTAKRRSFER